jgi:hypothetical protein
MAGAIALYREHGLHPHRALFERFRLREHEIRMSLTPGAHRDYHARPARRPSPCETERSMSETAVFL